MPKTFGVRDFVPDRQLSVCTAIRIAIGGLVVVLCLFLGFASTTIATDDAYIAGYAAAVLHNEFKAAQASVVVQDGVVTVDAESLGTVDQAKVQTALEKIPGVTRVEIRQGPAVAAVPTSAPPETIKQETP